VSGVAGALPTQVPATPSHADKFRAAGFDSPERVRGVRRTRRYSSAVNERIDFYCSDPGHQTLHPGEQLTMHDERWAYCPKSAAGEHRWQPTGGM